jgi:hypothetical protein
MPDFAGMMNYDTAFQGRGKFTFYKTIKLDIPEEKMIIFGCPCNKRRRQDTPSMLPSMRIYPRVGTYLDS